MQRNWACRLGGWFLWGSTGVFLGVVGTMEIAFFVPIPQAEGYREVLWTFLLRPGFALALAAFLLGIGCHLVEGRLGGRG